MSHHHHQNTNNNSLQNDQQQQQQQQNNNINHQHHQHHQRASSIDQNQHQHPHFNHQHLRSSSHQLSDLSLRSNFKTTNPIGTGSSTHPLNHQRSISSIVKSTIDHNLINNNNNRFNPSHQKIDSFDPKKTNHLNQQQQQHSLNLQNNIFQNHHRRTSSQTSAASTFSPRLLNPSLASNTLSSSTTLNNNTTTVEPNPTSQTTPPIDSHLSSNSIDQQKNNQPIAVISPLTTIANRLPYLKQDQQEPIKRTLQLINQSSSLPSDQSKPHQPTTLLLAHSWTLFFSDTSFSKNTNRNHGSQRDHTSLLKAAEYQSGMSEVFTGIKDVEGLCASLAGFKFRIAEEIKKGNMVHQHGGGMASPTLKKKFGVELPNSNDKNSSPVELIQVPGNGLGLIAMKPGHNLHFFRGGVNPVWEDPWNAKGGRLTIQTPLPALDPTFEAIVLLTAGGVLESDAHRKWLSKQRPGNNNENGKNGPPLKEGGRVVGVVGSRRGKGDRIDIWLSGATIGTSPSEEWIKSIQNVLADELGSPEVLSARYKKHF